MADPHARADAVNATRQRVINLIAQSFRVPADYVKPDTDIFADLGGDEVDKLDVTTMIEDAFEIEFTDEDIEHATTVEAFAFAVDRVRQRKEAA